MPGMSDCPAPLKRQCRRSTIVQFFLISVSLTLTLVLVTGIIWYSLVKNEKRLIANSGTYQIMLAEEFINTAFETFVADTYLFAGLRVLSEYCQQPTDETRQRLIESFFEIGRYRPQYDQIRFIDTNGGEVVRLQQEHGAMQICPDSLLQNKSDRYYVTETLGLKTGEVYISPFDLNIERGVIEDKPMIRIATPVYCTEDTLQGIVVLNYLGEHLKKRFYDGSAVTAGNIQLLNGDGYWLHSDHREDEWGFMYDDRINVSFRERYPEVWARIASELDEEFQMETANGLFTVKTIMPIQNLTLSKVPQHQSYKWILVSQVSQAELTRLSFWFLRMFIMVNVLIELLLLVGAALIAQANFRRRMANFLLTEAASTDPLTGLTNRRTFTERFNAELARYGRTHSPFSIILADIDHFKSINDTYGHNIGDKVLRSIAAIFRDSIRHIDIVSRWGGEEIILLLPETTDEQAAGVAEKLRITVAEQVFADAGRRHPVTLSFGVCGIADEQTLEHLVKKADSALYQSKAAGRNCVTLYDAK